MKNVPDPRTISPALWGRRDVVFNWLELPYKELVRGLTILEPVTFAFTTEAVEMEYPKQIQLHPRRAVGLAPWTEHPYSYQWIVAVGPDGYWAAGEAWPMPYL